MASHDAVSGGFTYECLDCESQVTVDSRPSACPQCDGRLRNLSFERRWESE